MVPEAQRLESGRNMPLGFRLKGVDPAHPALAALGVGPTTCSEFGIGYFAGKGMMRGKVVIPFEDVEGRLVAYVGCSPEDGSLSYPPGFDRTVELFNFARTEQAGLFCDGVALTTDLLSVLRLAELGVERVVGLPTDTLHEPQLELLECLVGSGGRVDLVALGDPFIDALAMLLPRFYVRLHHVDGDDAGALLPLVARTIPW